MRQKTSHTTHKLCDKRQAIRHKARSNSTQGEQCCITTNQATHNKQCDTQHAIRHTNSRATQNKQRDKRQAVRHPTRNTTSHTTDIRFVRCSLCQIFALSAIHVVRYSRSQIFALPDIRVDRYSRC